MSTGNSPPPDGFQGPGNPFGDNHYAAPPVPQGSLAAAPYPVAPSTAGRGMTRHVPVVAILMMVQGVLELLAGLGLMGMGVFMVFMVRTEHFQQGAGGGPPPEQFGWIMLGMYGGMGLIALVAGGLHLFAGMRNYRFRSRTLGFVALGGGLAAIFICYCAPSAIALSVYGLITYVNPEVGQAFAMGDAGRTREEIFAAFP
jgi:hypothetical protein